MSRVQLGNDPVDNIVAMPYKIHDNHDEGPKILINHQQELA